MRIGEASNPGPKKQRPKKQPCQAVVAIINPTAIRNKHEEFTQLMNTFQVNTFCCAETSATTEVQQSMQYQFHKLKLSTVWSHPVLAQREKVSNQPSLRGKAGGTSIHSMWPLRSGMSSHHDPEKAPDRITHAIVQWGGMYVQIITIYGYTGGNSWHKHATNQLFANAIQKAENINLPVMFAGDFNMDVHQLDLYDFLEAKGYSSLQRLHEHMYGFPMPKTCKDATTPDTAILHPTLIQRLVSIQVDKQGLFDAHDPVILAFDIPHTPLYHTTISTPKTWIDMPIDKSDLEEAATSICQHAMPQTLQEWATLVEMTVDHAIKTEHRKNYTETSTTTGLPRRCRGRCAEPKFRQIPLVTPAKKARDGDFNPPFECATFQSKKFVKQIRRLSSLQTRLRSLANVTQIWPRTYVDLWREWTAILHWSHKRKSFMMWSLDQPELHPFPAGLPTADWLHLAKQFMQHQLHDLLFHEHALRAKMSKIRHIIDCQDNFKKEAYRVIKKKDFQPFHHVYKTLTEDAIVVQHELPLQYECFVAEPSKFQPMSPVQANGVEASLIQQNAHSIFIRMPEGHEPLQEQVTLTQAQCTFQVQEVFDELSGFWQQFWYKDEPDDGKSFDEVFHQPAIRYPSLPDTFEDDLTCWKEALASCKGDSAPGVDGFTFHELKMLPDQLLTHLVRIISSMDAFPPHLMLAKTIPLPKKGKLSAENSRPITIMATLYRLWGKVCARRCLRHLAGHVSSAITGMLPHRGAHDASYMLQTHLELCRLDNTHVTGLTLDLRKCFNLLTRNKVRQLLVNHGLPPRLVQKWFDSISRLCRYWDVSKACSQVFPSNHGCPEGDAWSVVAMVCTAETWSGLVCSQEPSIKTAAYADNWTYWQLDQQLSPGTTNLTQMYVQWLGLEISWEKTWVWSTSTTGAPKLKQLISHLAPVQVLQTQINATDLGCQMTYHGTAKLGILQDRLMQAKQRLELLKHCTWVLPLKVHMVQTCVLPLALYGSELVAVGQKHLATLRTQIADALTGESIQTMSSSIFLHCATSQDIDPHIQILFFAIKAARRFLTNATGAEQQKFFQVLSKQVQTVGLSQGPASALREYLQRLGLRCSSTGHLQLTAFRTCHMLDTPYTDLHRYIQWAWQEQLLLHHTQRPKLYKLPPINKSETFKMLKQFPPKKQLLLLREIAGAFQTAEQKAKWNEDQENVCSFCGSAGDTRQHRTFFCLAFEKTREAHHDFVAEIAQDDPDFVDLPVIFCHPHFEFHDALLYNMPRPEISRQTIQTLEQLGVPCLAFYTDGSCMHPTSTSTCFSAFSVTVDMARDDSHRKDLADIFMSTGTMPNTFQTISVGRTQGRQQIHRAELSAIILIFEHFDSAVVYTDSATAISLVSRCRCIQDVTELIHHDDYDLLSRLFHVLTPAKKVEKVKAHQQVRLIADPLQRYHALGNTIADLAANTACTGLLPEVVQQLQEHHNDLLEQRDKVLKYYNLNLDLQTARAQASAVRAEDSGPALHTHVDIRNLLCNWQVLDVWVQPSYLDDSELVHSVWGFQWAVALLEWIQSCQWPAHPVEGDPGLSWSELAICLMLQQQQWLPVKRQRATFNFIFQANSPQDLEDLAPSFSELSTTVYHLMSQLQGLIVQPILPNHCKYGKCRALYLQGHAAWSTGLSCRPRFAQQEQVFDILHRYLSNHSGLVSLPDLQLSLDCEMWVEDMSKGSFEERVKASRAAMLRVRKKRKGLNSD